MTQRQHAPSSVAPQARPQIDADALNAAVARQRAHDEAQPPSRHLSKMAAVRIAADLIAMRRENGWTDAQIVALLRDQLNVDITVGTLRVYVHRLRSEGSFRRKPDARLDPADRGITAVQMPRPGSAMPANAVPILPERMPIATSETGTDGQDVASYPPSATGCPPAAHRDSDDASAPPPSFSRLIDLDEDV